ncbi:hypothetical protein WJX81_006311 [Elliptochloris bilobata]|uniref:Uncharacterized protein n=1 Tax=Elliptochloris bilobata TaxID=381761 RepID=A0AAW1QM42_9CHLO
MPSFFLEPDRAEPHIPASVLAVVAFGFSTSAFLIGIQPWSKTPRGAWDIPADAITRCSIGSPHVLLTYRALLFCYCLGLGVSQTVTRGVWVFAYYTMWCWWALVAYFGLATLASLRAVGQERSPLRGATLDRLGYTVVVLFHLILTTTAMVDVFTWGLLVPMLAANPDPVKVAHAHEMFYNFFSYNTHGANSLFAIGELLLNSIPFVPHLMGYVGFWTSAFGIWAFSVFRVTGMWLYPFLDASRPWAPFAYAGIYAASWVLFGLVALQFRARAWLFRHRRALKHD